MTNAFVWGVGTSLFGKQPHLSAGELMWAAVSEALSDAKSPSVDAVFVGTCFGEPGVAQRWLHRMGVSGIPISIYENACASSTQAFHEACTAIDYGRFERVLVVGVEQLTSRFSGAIPVEQRDYEGRTGLALPALYAMSATRYKDTFGLTDEQLAMVSVKNHANGLLNPRAQHRVSVNLEEVLSSKMIADPLTLLQCCAISDGAGACVVGNRKRSPRDVTVQSTEFLTGSLWNQRSQNVWGFDLIAATAARALEMANLGIGDVDVLEVHDAFTIGEIVTTEALGMAPIGGGGELVQSGHTQIRGPQPVNPSGGLLARGHPLGATGTAQIAEIVWQLRGDAQERQTPNARVGLVETMGGGAAGVDGNACVVSILTT